MKIQLCFVAILLALVSVNAHPGIERPDDDAEVVVVPLEAGQHQNNPFDVNYGEFGEPIVDTGNFPGFFSFNPFYNNPFAGFFTGLEANLDRMRQEIQKILTRLPSEDSVISDIEKKGNTTSTVKIIDGHKVIVNETTYNADNDGGVIRIRVVEVKPDEEESSEPDIANRFASDEEKSKAPQESEEDNSDKKSEAEDMSPTTTDVENDIGNEIDVVDTHEKIISLSKPSINNKLTEEFSDETYDGLVDDNFESNGWKVDNTEKWAEERPSSDNNEPEYRPETWESVESIPEFDDILLTNDVDNFQPIDLSNDILVNQMMADSGAPINPDAEIFIPNPRYIYPRFESIRNSRVQRSMSIK